MGRFLNKGNLDFAKVRKSEYVDKSAMIHDINLTLDTERCCSCVTRCRRFGKFSQSDVERLDRLQTFLFGCFEPASVAASIKSLKQAKLQNEPCPFSEESLNELFGKVK